MITLSHILILLSVAIMFFNIAQYLLSGILRADSMLKITKKSLPYCCESSILRSYLRGHRALQFLGREVTP